MLAAAGLDVEFLPFDGPHTIPLEAIERVAALIRRVADQGAAPRGGS
jgi:hypothetical protein